MPIFRWLILFLAVWLAIVLIRQLAANRVRHKSGNKPDVTNHYADVVACDYCQLHIPKVEAVEKNGRYYCCIEHQNAKNQTT